MENMKALLGVLTPEQKAVLLAELSGNVSVATKDTSVAKAATIVPTTHGAIQGVVLAPVVDKVAVSNVVSDEKPAKKGKVFVAYRVQVKTNSETARKRRFAGDVEYLTERQVQMTIKSYVKNDSEQANTIMGIMNGGVPEFANPNFVIRPLPQHVDEATVVNDPITYPTSVEVTQA